MLLGGPELPGRIYSDEVYFALSPARCTTQCIKVASNFEIFGEDEDHGEKTKLKMKLETMLLFLLLMLVLYHIISYYIILYLCLCVQLVE